MITTRPFFTKGPRARINGVAAALFLVACAGPVSADDIEYPIGTPVRVVGLALDNCTLNEVRLEALPRPAQSQYLRPIGNGSGAWVETAPMPISPENLISEQDVETANENSVLVISSIPELEMVGSALDQEFFDRLSAGITPSQRSLLSSYQVDIADPVITARCVPATFEGQPIILNDRWTLMFETVVPGVNGEWVIPAVPRAAYYDPRLVLDPSPYRVDSDHIVDPQYPVPTWVPTSEISTKARFAAEQVAGIVQEILVENANSEFRWYGVDYSAVTSPREGIYRPIATGILEVGGRDISIFLFCSPNCALLVRADIPSPFYLSSSTVSSMCRRFIAGGDIDLGRGAEAGSFSTGECVGLFEGLVTLGSNAYCLPTDTVLLDTPAVIRMVIGEFNDYVTANFDVWNAEWSSVATIALAAAFPCGI